MRYFLAFLIVVGLVILGFILFFRLLFSGSGEDQPVDKPAESLTRFANTEAIMRFTVDGPVAADQEHYKIRIDVSRDVNEISLITGYENDVTKSERFNNNSTSYADFLRAIDLAGFTLGDPNPNLVDDRGYCPSGNRYIYEIIEGDKTTQRWWSTSCAQDEGNFRGSSSQVVPIFQAQIPEYDEVTADFPINVSSTY